MTNKIHNYRVHDLPADAGIITRLHKLGMLNDRARHIALKKLRPPSVWYDMADRMLLFYGSALLLLGILFFFAYNWSDMSRVQKFGLLEGAILLSALTSCINRYSEITRKICLMSASVLTGVLLAVFGQIYQTGADAFELFRGWALLISLYVIISEFSALWFLWIMIVNTGMVFYVNQVIDPYTPEGYHTLCLIIAGFNGFFLILKETLGNRFFYWLKEKWTGVSLLVITLIAFDIPLTHFLADITPVQNRTLTISFFLILCTSGFLYYQLIKRDLLSTSLLIANLTYLILLFIGRVIFVKYNNEAESFLLYGLIVIAIVSGTAFILKKLNESMKKAGDAHA